MALVDRKTGEKTPRPKYVKQDQVAIMRLESQETFCLDTFKDFPQMGRFTLRDEGTIKDKDTSSQSIVYFYALLCFRQNDRYRQSIESSRVK